MELNKLADNQGARKSRMRVGRGVGSGKGKTAGRGYKGQKSREGVSINGFEGGQMPIHRRLPKRGFNNPFRKTYETVNLRDLQRAIDAKKLDAAKPVNGEALANAGLIRDKDADIKLLATGDVTVKLTIDVAHASQSAQDKVKKAGGSVKLSVEPKQEKAAKSE